MPAVKERCTAPVFREKQEGRCARGAWWPGGLCALHLKADPPSSFTDWLLGIVAGSEADTLPRSIAIMAMQKRLVEPREGEPYSFWTNEVDGPHDAKPVEAARVVLFGRSAAFLPIAGIYLLVHESELHVAVDPDIATVAIDQTLTRTDSATAQLLAVQVAAAVERTGMLDEARLAATDLDAIERYRAPKLPYVHGNIRRAIKPPRTAEGGEAHVA